MPKPSSAKTDALRAMREAKARKLEIGEKIAHADNPKLPKPKGPPPARGPAKGSSTARAAVDHLGREIPSKIKPITMKDLGEPAALPEKKGFFDKPPPTGAKKPVERHESVQPGLAIKTKAGAKSSIPKPKKKVVVKELQEKVEAIPSDVRPPAHPDCERCKYDMARAAKRVSKWRKGKKV